ncbi:hypothetical protein C7H19_12695 [Aphanothece hegewaldii CCALA 016]|uniref:Cyclic nucleotide-binding protein n=1 Tax=Aphanothece hegewaldii CCALA 016 TaxID=2107694 RepID=A0A2T1LXA8_9CHRO|nr:hypothetical protein [Aphanothece hegewaldii]PSF36819.1 hypothetical protein C7H19_12695 [Aphanothece hegewaldii CCALA 016]
MLNQVAEAIDHYNYKKADYLLQEWKKQEIDNPWIDFYEARLAEVTGKYDLAHQKYRDLLQQTSNHKLIAQIRQGIDRLTEIEAQLHEKVKEKHLKALAQAKLEPGSQEAGILILEPIPTEEKKQAAQQFAQVMEIDPYTARLQLPSRAWRLYRTGTIGELGVFVETLKAVNIPCFCATVKDIQNVKVYQIDYFKEVFPIAIVVCHLSQSKPVIFKFDWSELSQRVEGMLPIFEECVEMGLRGKIERKTKTLDYVQVCDLHLKERNMILRLCDQTYKFNQETAVIDKQTLDETTISRDHWNHLMSYFKKQFPHHPVYDEFTPFAETALDFPETLKLIQPHLDLLRREDTFWDQVFHLYSSLALIKEKS